MARARKAAEASPAPAKTEETAEVSLLDQIVEEGRLARDPAARERSRDLVKEFVQQVLEGEMMVSKDAEAMINARIAQIDHLISIQLNEILHHPDFQKLEASWRGLKCSGPRSLTRAPCSSRCTKRNSARSAERRSRR